MKITLLCHLRSCTYDPTKAQIKSSSHFYKRHAIDFCADIYTKVPQDHQQTPANEADLHHPQNGHN